MYTYQPLLQVIRLTQESWRREQAHLAVLAKNLDIYQKRET